MKTKYKYIEFVIFPDCKPPSYKCINRKAGHELGQVGYYKTWNCYVFVPTTITAIFSIDCFEDIVNFMKQLSQEEMAF